MIGIIIEENVYNYGRPLTSSRKDTRSNVCFFECNNTNFTPVSRTKTVNCLNPGEVYFLMTHVYGKLRNITNYLVL